MEKMFLELNSVFALLEARDDDGAEALFVTGGTEIYLNRIRAEGCGSCFFFYSTAAGEKLLFFPEHPVYFMVPFQEPHRLELYLPPEAKIMNFPLVFENRPAEQTLFSTRKESEVMYRLGGLEREKVLLLEDRRYVVKSGVLSAAATTAPLDEFEAANCYSFNPAGDGADRIVWNQFDFRHYTGPFSSFTGVYNALRPLLENKIGIRGKRGETVITVPAGGRGLVESGHYLTAVDGVEFLNLLSRFEGNSIAWTVLPLQKNVEYQIGDKGVVHLMRQGTRLHIVQPKGIPS